jgi:3-hydroxyisobutyrate dehydrogenase
MARRIGVVGLGNMGGRIGARIAGAGHPVIGLDIDPGRAETIGIEVADSLGSLCAASDAIFLSLPDSTVVESVVLGDDRLMAHSRAGQTVIDLSTAAPSSTQRLERLLSERGVAYIDAGISGGAAAAEKGTLTIMAGGSRDALDALADVFASFASKVIYMGSSGAGHSAKVLNNFLNAVSLAATAEVMVAGKKAGLDMDTLLEALNSSSGVNFATMNRFPRIVHGDYLEGGLTSKLMTKDVVLYLDHTRELGVPALNASGPLASFGLATQLGYGDQISNRVVDAIGDVSGHIRLHDSAGEGGSQR